MTDELRAYFGSCQMTINVHAIVDNTHNADPIIQYHADNQMMSMMVYPYRGIQFGTLSGNQRLYRQQLYRSIQVIEVFVSLFFSPLVKGLQPNFD